jgi:excisionase family DNA binding protein
MKKTYTVDEVAKKLEVSVKTIRRYIYSGKLAANKIGGSWKISEEQIEDYYESISSSNVCCQETIDRDDFCIFMDTDYFSSEDKLQLCTIVDYYAESIDAISDMSSELLKLVTEDGVKGGKAQFNYVYDQPLGRARFVIWGTAAFIEKAANLLKGYSV